MGDSKQTERRRAWMREYMRRRRAKLRRKGRCRTCGRKSLLAECRSCRSGSAAD